MAISSEKYIGRKFSTKFVSKNKIIDSEFIKDIITAGRKLAKYGLTPNIAGNISVRYKNGMLIKAGGCSLGKLKKDDVVMVTDYSTNKNTAYVSGLKEPSSETPTHWRIYKNFKKVNAIVHVHDKLILKKQRLAKKLGIKFTEKEEPYGTLKLAKQILKALKKSNYVIIKNHGSIAVGKNLNDAVNLILLIHEYVKHQSGYR